MHIFVSPVSPIHCLELYLLTWQYSFKLMLCQMTQSFRRNSSCSCPSTGNIQVGQKLLAFFCSSSTTEPIWIKFGRALRRGKQTIMQKFYLAAFRHCWETVHENFVKQQKLVKQVKNWTFANGNETICAGVVVSAECENELQLLAKLLFALNWWKMLRKLQNYVQQKHRSYGKNSLFAKTTIIFESSANNYCWFRYHY